jgi:hypothetical protein
MLNPLTIINRLNISTNNHIDAVQDAKALYWKTPKQFRQGIVDLVDDAIDTTTIDDKHVRHLFYYLIQNFVKTKDEVPLNIQAIVKTSLADTDRLMGRIYGGDLHYLLHLEEYGGDVINQDGTTTHTSSGRKGQKKDKAAVLYAESKDTLSRHQIIDLFMKELSMSKAGATTYFYNLVKKA